MGKRAIHYEDWQPTAYDPDGPDSLFCGTEGEFEQHHFTRYTDQVTCRRCLKILSAMKGERDAQDIKSKAGCWDDLNRRAKELGYPGIRDAMADLCKLKGVPLFAEF
jgi:hypothetical protein